MHNTQKRFNPVKITTFCLIFTLVVGTIGFLNYDFFYNLQVVANSNNRNLQVSKLKELGDKNLAKQGVFLLELEAGVDDNKTNQIQEIVESQSGLVIDKIEDSVLENPTYIVSSDQLKSTSAEFLANQNSVQNFESQNSQNQSSVASQTEEQFQEAVEKVENTAQILAGYSQVKAIHPVVNYSFSGYSSGDRYIPNQNPFYQNQWYLKPAPEGIDTGLGWTITGQKLDNISSSEQCLTNKKCAGTTDTKIAIIDTGLDAVLDLAYANIDRANSARIYYSDECPDGSFDYLFDSQCVNFLLEKCVEQGNSAFDCQTKFEFNFADFLSLIKCNIGDKQLFNVGGYKICQQNGASYDLPYSAGGSFHGTMVASVIAMQDDIFGGVGVAYNTTILPVAIHTDLNTISITSAIQKAIEENVDIINLSFESVVKDVYLESFIKKAIQKGIVVIASSGNSGNSIPNYPASFEEVISVGASNWAPDLSQVRRACYASFGSSLDIVAPSGDRTNFGDQQAYDNCDFSGGGDYSFDENTTPTGVLVATPNPDRNYAPTNRKVYGTSFTAPMVAGAVALFKAINPTATPAQIEEALQVSALDVGQQGYDEETGYGLLNIPTLLNVSLSYLSTSSTSSNSSTTSQDISTSSNSSSSQTTRRGGGGGGGGSTRSSSSSTSAKPISSPIIPNQTCFDDVELTNAFVAFICQLKAKEAVSGDQEGKFRPDQNITRSEVVKIVYNTFKFSPQTSCGDFNDVGTENPLYNQITTLKCKGIINGVGDNNFAPNQNMTRAELVKIVMGILANVKKVNGIDAISLKTSPYVDVQTDNPFYSFIAMAYEYKIATGFEDKTFKPNEPITRGATTKIVTLADAI